MHFQPSQRIRSRLTTTICQSNVAQTQLIPIYSAPTRKRRQRQFIRCGFDGFYEPEVLPHVRYVWTSGKAKIECHFAVLTAIRYLWLDVAMLGPNGCDLQVRVAGNVALSRRHLAKPQTVLVRTAETLRVSHLVIELECSTFVPRDCLPDNQDVRVLGIALREIVLAKRRSSHEGLFGNVRALPHVIPEWLQQWWSPRPSRAA